MATTGLTTGDPKTDQVRSYLLREVDHGEEYFKSRFIAEDLDLTAHEIGAAFRKLKTDCPHLDIEKWSYTNGTTWRVTADFAADGG